ncbi:hypothetical protein [Mycoplasmopsis verecunda]|nr:hypothetical protein [Mycoplasmopsis verecunda]WPB54789.1 hypothetical protein SAM46_01370 [Mycoplasmopsis verecunda]
MEQNEKQQKVNALMQEIKLKRLQALKLTKVNNFILIPALIFSAL